MKILNIQVFPSASYVTVFSLPYSVMDVHSILYAVSFRWPIVYGTMNVTAVRELIDPLATYIRELELM